MNRMLVSDQVRRSAWGSGRRLSQVDSVADGDAALYLTDDGVVRVVLDEGLLRRLPAGLGDREAGAAEAPVYTSPAGRANSDLMRIAVGLQGTFQDATVQVPTCRPWSVVVVTAPPLAFTVHQGTSVEWEGVFSNWPL